MSVALNILHIFAAFVQVQEIFLFFLDNVYGVWKDLN